MDKVVEMVHRFGIDRGMNNNLAAALGAGEVDLLSLTSAYASLVNGGKRIKPALIERIQDRHGKTIERRDGRPCPACEAVAWQDQATPNLVDQREQIIAPARAYQMVNLLEGVVQRGTGVRARVLDKPVAGKTGTSNDARDAWFIGFTPDLVVGVFVGYDQPRSLGDQEQGATAALPIFIEIMQDALADRPATPFRVPPGVRLVRVDADTGLLPGPDTRTAILEAYMPGTEPTQPSPRRGASAGFDGVDGKSAGASPPATGAPRPGGLY
jgi:penicillin-binding protein 1A